MVAINFLNINHGFSECKGRIHCKKRVVFVGKSIAKRKEMIILSFVEQCEHFREYAGPEPVILYCDEILGNTQLFSAYFCCCADRVFYLHLLKSFVLLFEKVAVFENLLGETLLNPR